MEDFVPKFENKPLDINELYDYINDNYEVVSDRYHFEFANDTIYIPILKRDCIQITYDKVWSTIYINEYLAPSIGRYDYEKFSKIEKVINDAFSNHTVSNEMCIWVIDNLIDILKDKASIRRKNK